MLNILIFKHNFTNPKPRPQFKISRWIKLSGWMEEANQREIIWRCEYKNKKQKQHNKQARDGKTHQETTSVARPHIHSRQAFVFGTFPLYKTNITCSPSCKAMLGFFFFHLFLQCVRILLLVARSKTKTPPKNKIHATHLKAAMKSGMRARLRHQKQLRESRRWTRTSLLRNRTETKDRKNKTSVKRSVC